MLASSDVEGHHSLNVELVTLAHANPAVANAVVSNPRWTVKMLDRAAVDAQYMV